ncbi:hypothetical protein, partial [Klebsiella pneumoniae]|uniref:hypothetical protein n=1 Tax=Klebsiella pneumoniae TaxID=573 RepID=UPI001E2CAB0E
LCHQSSLAEVRLYVFFFVAGGHLLLLRGGSETMGRDGHGQYEHRDTQDIHRTLLEGLHVRMQVC